jgi:hypothetical protein
VEGPERTRAAWYFRSTPLWLLVMGAGSVIYVRETRKLRRQGVDLDARFARFPRIEGP